MLELEDLDAHVATRDEDTATLARRTFRRCYVSHNSTELRAAITQLLHSRPTAVNRPLVFLLDTDVVTQKAWSELEKLAEASAAFLVLLVSSSFEKDWSQVSQATQSWLSSFHFDLVPKPVRREDLYARLLVHRMHPELDNTSFPEKDAKQLTGVHESFLDAPLQHLVENLHDPISGHLNAKSVAAFFGVSVADLARAIGREVSTVHKTPTSGTLQSELRPLESIASGLVRLTGSDKRARMWLQSTNPALDGHAPIEILKMGRIGKLGAFVQDLLEGRPA
jgi:Protein of unknown function (DUF2384)